MSLLASQNLTLLDWAKRRDPDGKIPVIAELLSQTNEVLFDAVFKEGNQPTGHRVVVRTGLPTVYWRALNAGVPTSKSTTAQVDEGCAMLEAYSEVDVALAKLNAAPDGSVSDFRLSEDRAFIESMNQTQAYTMFYGNVATEAKSYTGLATRYSSLSAGNGGNIIDAGGSSTDNTSIYLVVWGDETVFCPFPKGSKAGIDNQDLGEQTVSDANGGRFQAYRSHYKWDNGLVVKDWRYVVRIANIDVSNLVSESSAADLIKLMSRALDKIPNLNMGRAAFYMNRTVYSMLRIQALGKSNNAVTIEKGLNQFGTVSTWAAFQGVPLRKVEALLNTEARVV